MGTFSPRADCGTVLCRPSAGIPDTVAKWRTRSFRAVNSFDVSGYGVGASSPTWQNSVANSPAILAGNSAWHQKPAWTLRRESPWSRTCQSGVVEPLAHHLNCPCLRAGASYHTLVLS